MGGMGWMQVGKMGRRDAHLFRHPAAVLRNIGRIVFRAEAAIEALVDAIRHPALAREEGVTQAGNGREQRRSHHHESSASVSGSYANPATAVRSGSETAINLNIEPMPPRPVPTSRFIRPEI